MPARTSLTITSGSASTVSETTGSAPGIFGACEAIWGGPLYRKTVPSLPNREIVPVSGSGCNAANYSGLVKGKIALVARGCDFIGIARTAESAGADAVLVSSATVFAPDPSEPGDAGVTIPFAMISGAAGKAIRDADAAGETVTGTLADQADTWGALRIFDVSGGTPRQTAVFNAPHTRVDVALQTTPPFGTL
jgi:hypothetical protein